MRVLPDFKDRAHSWVRSVVVSDRQVYTVSGLKYRGMVDRCTPGAKQQRDHPCYVGCSNGFADFQEFCDWHVEQRGYGEFQLDKDCLVRGNKIYSPQTCILLPGPLNRALLERPSSEGLMTGVARATGGAVNLYVAKCVGYGKNGYAGIFKSVEDAHAAYLKAKKEVIEKLAEHWKSQIDPRAYEALMNRYKEPTCL